MAVRGRGRLAAGTVTRAALWELPLGAQERLELLDHETVIVGLRQPGHAQGPDRADVADQDGKHGAVGRETIGIQPGRRVEVRSFGSKAHADQVGEVPVAIDHRGIPFDSGIVVGVATEHQAILLIDQLGKQSVKVLAQRAAPKLWVKRTTRRSTADRLAASMTSRTATASQGSTGGGASPASAAATPA